MATSPTYLPTHSLTVNSSPTNSDFIIAQMAGNNGDTGLINIGTFMNTFVQGNIDDIDIRMDGIDTRLDGVDTSISAIQTAMGNVKMKAVSKTVTIPTGRQTQTQTSVDFTNDLPSNTRLMGVDVTLGDFHLPYMSSGNTWIAKMWERGIRIDNTSGAYNDYTMLAVLFYVDVASS